MPTVQVNDSGGIYNGGGPVRRDHDGGRCRRPRQIAGRRQPERNLLQRPQRQRHGVVERSERRRHIYRDRELRGQRRIIRPRATTTFTIGKATPTVQVSDVSGIYTGSAFAAAAMVAGVNGSFNALLEGVGITLTYYAGTSASGTPSPSVPVNNGTYTVVASFPAAQL